MIKLQRKVGQTRNRSTYREDDHYLKEVKTELVTMNHVNMLGLDLVDTNNNRKKEQLEWKLECCEREMELQVA